MNIPSMSATMLTGPMEQSGTIVLVNVYDKNNRKGHSPRSGVIVFPNTKKVSQVVSEHYCKIGLVLIYVSFLQSCPNYLSASAL